jgi:hypothetical protein
MNVAYTPTQETLLAYVEGELLPAQARQVEAYLLHEPALKAQIDGMKRDLAGMRAMPQVKAPASLMRGVLERLDGTVGDRMGDAQAPISFAASSSREKNKSGRLKRLFSLQVIGLSGLAAAATLTLTLGLVYFNAPPAHEPTNLPMVPRIARGPVAPVPATETVNNEPGAEAGTQVAVSKTVETTPIAAPEALGVDDLELMSKMAEAAEPEEAPTDQMFVVELPVSSDGTMVANAENVTVEPGQEFQASEHAVQALHEIAAQSRVPSELKVNDMDIASLITATGSPAPSQIDRPAMGPSMAEMTPESSDVAGMQVRTINLAFGSADTGQKAILDWAGKNDIRVLSTVPAGEQVAVQQAKGTQELRLVVTQEQMESMLSGVTMADAGGAVVPSTTARALASRAASTAVASMETPVGEARSNDGATTQPAAAEGKKLFVLQVMVSESGR